MCPKVTRACVNNVGVHVVQIVRNRPPDGVTTDTSISGHDGCRQIMWVPIKSIFCNEIRLHDETMSTKEYICMRILYVYST